MEINAGILIQILEADPPTIEAPSSGHVIRHESESESESESDRESDRVSPANVESNEWGCSLCTFENVAAVNICEMCGTAATNEGKETGTGTGTGTGAGPEHGDAVVQVEYLCSAPDCTSASRIACSICKSERYCTATCQSRCW